MTVPLAFSSPDRIRKSADLPDPFGPTIAVICPDTALKLTSLRMVLPDMEWVM
jgi:hypothetical protein